MFDIVKNDLEKLEEILLEVVSSPVPLITEIGTHLVKAGGKRLRPALYFLANCKVARTKNIMDLAVALELIHMATLVHDDVVDKAATRRGIFTANAKWGNQISVLTGDYLFSKAFSLVAQNPNSRIMSVLTDLICAMSEGEIIQNQEIFVPEMEESVYFTKIAKKTADFIAASCELGAIMAELSTDEVEALRQYGYCIGMAFQITDVASSLLKFIPVFGSFFGGRASGGMVNSGGTYLVGEQGPEILQMSGSGGMVYNNSQTNKLMNQSLNKSNPINVYVSSNIDQRYLKVGIEKYNANQKYIRA